MKMFYKLQSGVKAVIQLILQTQIQPFNEFLEQCLYRAGA